MSSATSPTVCFMNRSDFFFMDSPEDAIFGNPFRPPQHEAAAAADEPGDSLPAMGALFQRRVGHPLLLLEFPALGAFVFVGGHVFLRRDRSSYPLIIAHSP